MGVVVMGVWNLLAPESENSLDFLGVRKSVLVFLSFFFIIINL